jgi:phosphomannomutase / phosphoglucomutase
MSPRAAALEAPPEGGLRLRQWHRGRLRAAAARGHRLRGRGARLQLDHTFPRYNPNPEDLAMLAAIAEAVLDSGADIGLGFDGDGDRCGVVDNEGQAIFADKVGVLLARDLSARHAHAVFVADVKSTALFATDPVLSANGASTTYWKTGHSYMKRRTHGARRPGGVREVGALFLPPADRARL